MQVEQLRKKLSQEINKLLSDTELHEFLKNNYNNDTRRIISYLTEIRNTQNMVENFKKYIDYLKMNKVHSTSYLYDKNLIALKFNISLQQAEEYVQNIKKNKATNLQKFIERHGEELGRQKFLEFQKSSAKAIQNINALGKERALKIHRSNSRRCPEFYLKRNLATSIEEANRLATAHQLNNAGVNVSYWQRKGLSDEEIRSKKATIDKKKGFGYREYMLKYPDTWKERVTERWDAYRKTINAIPPELFEVYSNYRNEVDKFTNRNCIIHADKILNLSLRGRDFHLDHKFSVKMGFINNIDPEIIAHWSNLEIIPANKNCSKGRKCSQTLEQLLENYQRNQNED